MGYVLYLCCYFTYDLSWAGDLAQCSNHLSGKSEVMSLNPSIKTKQNKKTYDFSLVIYLEAVISQVNLPHTPFLARR